jgi:hypothetical protein
MFAHHHAPEAPLYEFDFELEEAGGLRRDIDPRADLGIGEIAFKRLFFADYYGSVDARHPSGHHPDDSPDRFLARLGDFCSRIARIIEKRTQRPPRSIGIHLITRSVARTENGELRPSGVIARQNIVEFDVKSGKLRRSLPP